VGVGVLVADNVGVAVGDALTVAVGYGVGGIYAPILALAEAIPIFFHIQNKYLLSPNPAGFGSPYS
jgi:hypothetical protein